MSFNEKSVVSTFDYLNTNSKYMYRRRTPAIGFHFDLMSHHSYVIANVVSK